MIAEYGIFTEEGCIMADYYDRASAEAQAKLYRTEAQSEEINETYTVYELCSDHRDAEQPKDGCEECYSD